MKGRLIAAVAAVMAVASVLGVVACGGAAPDAAPVSGSSSSQSIESLRVGIQGINPTLDPSKAFNCDHMYCYHIYDHLVTYGPDGRLVPSLAERVENPNPTTYVYHLRRGVKFWNGNEMTSADVVYSLDIQRKPGTTSAVTFTAVESIEAPDPYTVVITLKRPDAGFPYELAYGGPVFEKAFYEANKDKFGEPGTLVMATGPYTIDKFDPLAGIELSANPNYWGPKPRVERLSFKVFADETGAALAFRAGEIDVFLPYEPKAFATTAGVELLSVPSLAMTYLFMNYKQAPWDDVHVRRAVAYAVNRPDLMTVAGGYNAPADTFIPTSQLMTLGSASAVEALVNSLPKYEHNLDTAKAEMAMSNYPDGFTVTTQTIASYQPQHEVLADQLKEIGIELKIETVDSAKWLAAARGPKTYELLFTGWAEISPDPGAFPSHLLKKVNVSQETGAGTNFANYDPPAVDELIAAGVATTDPAERLAIYGDLLTKMQEDMPILPLYLTNQTLAISDEYEWPEFDYYDTLRPWALDILSK